jgi:FAD:protein FMN transferase
MARPPSLRMHSPGGPFSVPPLSNGGSRNLEFRRMGGGAPPFSKEGAGEDFPARAKITTTLTLLTLVALLGTACTPTPVPVESFQGETMGTRYTVKVVGALTPDAREALGALIDRRLEEVNSKMSTYREDSELSRFNRYDGDDPFPLSAETLEVMATAQRLGEVSGGAFDMTVGPLVNAWGFGPEGLPPEPPADEVLMALRQLVGYQQVILSADGARKARPEIQCDLSAVAKGYAVDRVAEALLEQGQDRFMVEAGGEVRTGGLNPEGEPWRIGIERPQTEGRGLQKILPLTNKAMATSGDYRNFYEMNGRRYSHTIDPRTGRPVEHAGASVSVVSDTCVEADGLATTLLVLGPEEGYAFALEQGLAVLFINHAPQGLTERATPAFIELAAQASQGGVQ